MENSGGMYQVHTYSNFSNLSSSFDGECHQGVDATDDGKMLRDVDGRQI